MKNLNLLLGFLFISCFSAYSQKDTSKVDQLFTKATEYSNKQKLDSAVVYFMEAEKICIDQKLWSRYVRCENELGVLMQWKNLKDSAFTYFRQAYNKALKIWAPNNPNLGSCYFNICFELRAKGQIDSALYYCENARRLWAQAYGENSSKVVDACNKMAFLYLDLTKYKETMFWFNRAKDININMYGPTHPKVAGSYGNIGLLFRIMGNLDKASENLEKGLAIYKLASSPDYERIAASYNNIGLIYLEKGDLDKAYEYEEIGLKLRIANLPEFHKEIASSYNNLSSIHYEKKEFKESLSLEKKALAIRKVALGLDHPVTAKSYENIGLFYYEQGDYNKALSYQKQALDIRLKNFPEFNPEIAISYTQIGNIYDKLKNFNHALLYHQKSLSIYVAAFGEVNQKSALCLLNIGAVYENLHLYDSAFYYHNKSLLVYKSIFGPVHPEVAENLRAISDIYFKRGNIDSALYFNNLAIRSLVKNWEISTSCTSINPDSIVYKPDLLDILSLRAEILIADDKMKNTQQSRIKAYDIHKYIAFLAEWIRSNMYEQDSKFIFTEKLPAILINAIENCNELYVNSKNPDYLDEAYSFCEYMKAGVLTEAIIESDAKSFAGLPDTVLRKEKNYKIELNILETKVKESIAANHKSIELDSLENLLFTKKEDYKKFKDLLKVSYPKYAELKSKPIIPSPGNICKLLKPSEAIVEYSFSDSLLFIFTFTDQGLNLKKIKPDKEFRNKTGNYITAINKIKPNEVNTLSPYLFNILLKPVWDDIKSKKTIHFVPDGELWYLPFESLYPHSNQTNTIDFTQPDYLIKHADISYGISSSLWYRNIMYAKKSVRVVTPFEFIGFAPVFDKYYAKGTSNNHIFYVDSLGTETAMRGGEENNWKLNPLPFSKSEVTDIQALFRRKQMSSAIYLYKDASKKNLVNEGKKGKILHIASHGIMNANEPGLTGIFLASDDTTSNSLNKMDKQVLFSGETYNLDLNADLLVLSACETGIGRLMNGEGVISISRGFMYAGVPNIIYSLWKIGDRNTHDLMVQFYTEYLNGTNYSNAMRNAKLSLIKKPELAFPKNWAGMVLVGN